MFRTNVKKVINYLVETSDEGTVTHLKLQKLLYYAQGFHLAMHKEPLFGDDFNAWAKGPVIPSVYQEYKTYGSNPIPRNDEFDISDYDEELQDFLDMIIITFGNYRAFELSDISHEEPPYKNTKQNCIIKKQLMADYFSEVLKENEEDEDSELLKIAKRRIDGMDNKEILGLA